VSGPHLLFVGNLEPRKGLPTLLDAYDLLPAAVARGVPLVLAGPPLLVDASLRRRLDARREGRVVELGYVPPDELAGLYRGASALCLPSVYEGFGFPLLEAMACGLPCAASDDPALVEVAGGAALHAPIGDPSALAAILERLLSDSALRRRQVEAGRTRARAFTWRASAARHLAIWRAVAQHQGLPG
jgi:alpha-1,3-rhamnosyl/mannosyltransferase